MDLRCSVILIISSSKNIKIWKNVLDKITKNEFVIKEV